MKDLGAPTQFQEIEIFWSDNKKVGLRQRSLIERLLAAHGMQGIKPVDTTKNLSGQLHKEDSSLNEMEQRFFWRIAGSLLYIAVNTRPSVAVAVSSLEPFVEGSTKSRMTAEKRVSRYFRGTKDYTFSMKPAHKHQLVAHADANWGGEPSPNRLSRTGIVVFYWNAPLYHTS